MNDEPNPEIRQGLTNFITGAVPDPQPALTREAFDAAMKRIMRYQPREKFLVVSRYDAIVIDVTGRPENFIEARRPIRLRIKSAWSYWRWRNEEGEGFGWRYALRDLRKNTHQVLTAEACREIDWRAAEIGRVTNWSKTPKDKA